MYDSGRNRNESQSFKYSCDGKSFHVRTTNGRGWMPASTRTKSKYTFVANTKNKNAKKWIDAKRNFDIFKDGCIVRPSQIECCLYKFLNMLRFGCSTYKRNVTQIIQSNWILCKVNLTSSIPPHVLDAPWSICHFFTAWSLEKKLHFFFHHNQGWRLLFAYRREKCHIFRLNISSLEDIFVLARAKSAVTHSDAYGKL